jgi:hypothetical protein
MCRADSAWACLGGMDEISTMDSVDRGEFGGREKDGDPVQWRTRHIECAVDMKIDPDFLCGTTDW